MLRGVRVTAAYLIIRRLLRRKAPDTIPRSLPGAATVDVYSIMVRKERDPWILVDDLSRSELRGREWNGSRFDNDINVSIADVDWDDLEITHFLGVNDITYRGLWNYIRIGLSQYYRVLLLWGRAQQYFLKLRTLTRRDRIAILRYVVEQEVRSRLGTTATVSSWKLMNVFYSPSWPAHPDGLMLERYYKLVLTSLVGSGDLTVSGTDYSISPNTISTLARHEEEERRHKEQVVTQRWIARFTVALVIIGAVQVWTGVAASRCAPTGVPGARN